MFVVATLLSFLFYLCMLYLQIMRMGCYIINTSFTNGVAEAIGMCLLCTNEVVDHAAGSTHTMLNLLLRSYLKYSSLD